MADDPSIHKRAFSYPLHRFHLAPFRPVPSAAPAYVSPAASVESAPRPLEESVAGLELNDALISTPPSMAMASFADRSLDEVVQPSELPIGSAVHMGSLPRTGVIKVANIPYTLTRQEVVQFLGRSACLIPPEQGSAIHIIMERSTGKTLDCFAEFVSPHQAREIVHSINRVLETGRSPRMGSRHVDVSLSSQDELLKNLFPHAKCISWVDGRPIQIPNDCNWSCGFNGFLTDEDLFCVLRHAEIPGRSAFASRVPQRTYESMISTLWKFPWASTTMYTVHTRQRVFDTLRGMIVALVARMDRENTVGLDHKLLHELVTAGLECPAFNPRMKYTLAYLARETDVLSRMPREYVLYFPFDTLVWLPQFDLMALQYYASLISCGRVSNTGYQGLEQRYTDEGQLLRIYGPIWYEWNEAVAKEKKYHDAIAYERRVLRELIVTGYLCLSGKQTTASSIGTAPKSPSPALSTKSNDSQKTVSAINVGGAPGPAVPVTPARRSVVAHPNSPMVRPIPVPGGSQRGIGCDWMFPRTARVPSQGGNLYNPLNRALCTSQPSTQSSPWYPSTGQDNERWGSCQDNRRWGMSHTSFGNRSRRGHSSRYHGAPSGAHSPW